MIIQITDKWRIVPYGAKPLNGWTIERLCVQEEATKERAAGETYWFNDGHHWYSSRLEQALDGMLNILLAENEGTYDVRNAMLACETMKQQIITAVEERKHV